MKIMKKLFYPLIVAAGVTMVATSCKDNNRLESESVSVPATKVPTDEYAEFKTWQAQQAQKELEAQKAAAAPKTTTVVHKHYTVNKSTPATATTEPAKKKGWSKAAKGTAIGAGAGAAAGAIISKNNRALGAVVGGIVGGGVGYGVGRSKDKKDGRY
jgi:hypothetical protein